MPVIFNPTVSLNADDTNASTSFRVITTLTGGSNGSIRSTFTTSSATTLSVAHAAVGIWTGSGSNGNTTATPTELLFNGGSGFVGLLAGASITSDFVNFSCASTDKLVVIIDVGQPGGNRFSSGNSNVDTWFLTGGASFNNPAPTGYTLISGTDYLVASVETNNPIIINSGTPINETVIWWKQ